MIYASDIIGKKVISLYESNFVGTISNLYLNKNKTKINIFELITPNEEKVFFDLSSTYSLGENITIKSNTSLLRYEDIDFSTLCPQIINKEIYNELGDFLGNVVDIVLNDKFYPQQIIISKPNTSVTKEYENLLDGGVDNKNQIHSNYQNLPFNKNSDIIFTTLSIKKLNRIGNVIITSSKENFKFSNLKPKISLNNNLKNNKVYLLEGSKEYKEKWPVINVDNTGLNNENSGQEKSDTKLNNTNNNTIAYNYKKIVPTSIPSNNFNFLIGRKVSKNIFANNNEIIIRKNTKITDKHIETASIYNKLRELSVYSQ